MKLKISLSGIFFVLIILFQNCWGIEEVRNIYVDGSSFLGSEDGTEEKPYNDIDEGFEAVIQVLPNYKQVNLFIAPNNESYKLKKAFYDFKTEKAQGAFTITTWIKNNMIQEKRATLEFGDGSWVVKMGTFIIQNIDFITQKGTIAVQGDSFKMEDMEILTSLLNNEKRFLTLSTHLKIEMKSLNFLMESATPFLIYQQEILDHASIINVQNITFTLPVFKEKDESQLCILPLLDFASQGGSIINIEDIRLESFEKDQAAALKYLFRIKSFQTANVRGIGIEKQDLHVKSCKLMSFENSLQVNINNMTLSSSRLFTKDHFVFFRAKKVLNFKMNDIRVISNTFEVQSDYNSFLVYLSSTVTPEFTNHFMSQNVFAGGMQILKLEDSETTNRQFQSVSPKLENITLEKNRNFGTKGQFSYLVIQSSNMRNLAVKNFLFSKNQLSGRIIEFVLFPNQIITSRVFVPIVLPLDMRDLTIEGNKEIHDLAFFTMTPIESELKNLDCLPMAEPYNVYLRNLTIMNNSFSKLEEDESLETMSLFKIGWSQIFIEGARIENNIFRSYSLVRLDQKPQTIGLSQIRFVNNTLESSQFIKSDYSKVNSPCLQRQEKGKERPDASVLYRISAVVDSEFAGISLNASVLFDLNNGFLIYKNNSFSMIELSNNSIFLTNRFSIPRLPLKSVRYSTDMNLIQILSSRDPQIFKIWKATQEELLGYESDLIYFYSLKQNTFNGIAFNNSCFLRLASNYGQANNVIQIQENKFGKIEFQNSRDGELNSLFSSESLYKMVIKGNEFEDIHGNISLFYLPSTTNSQTLTMNSNKILNVSGLNLLVFRSEKLGGFEFNNNQIVRASFSQSFVNVKARRIVGDLIVDGNYVLKSNFSVKVLNSQVARYSMISLSSIETDDSSKVTFRSNELYEIILSDAKVTSSPGEVSILMINSYQPIYFENNTWVNIKSAREGDLIYVPNAPLLKISESKISDIHFSSSKGFINVLTPNLVISKSLFMNIANYKNYGLVFLAPSSGHYRVTIVDSTFDAIDNAFYASVLTVLPLKNDGYTFTLEWAGCEAINVNDGLVYLKGGDCVSCSMKDTIVRGEVLFYQDSLVRLDSFSGAFEFSNVTLPVLADVLNPIVSMKENNVDFVFKNIEYFGQKDSLFYVASLDGGNLTIKDSLFENVNIRDQPLVRTNLPNLIAKEKVYSNIRFENTTFRSIGSFFGDFELNHYPIFSIAIPGSFVIENCTFERVSNIRVIEAYGLVKSSGENCKSPKKSFLMIKNSTFANLEYHFGPTIHISPNCLNPEIMITDSVFENSKASYGGGAISLSNNVSLEVSNSMFKNLQVSQIGAAILAPGETINQIKLNNVTFMNNTARYPGNISSPATKISLKFISLNDYESEDALVNISSIDFQYGYFQMDFLDANGKPAPELSPSRDILFSVPVFEINQVTSEKVMTNNTFAAIVNCGDSVFSCKVYPQNVKLAGKAFELIHLTFSYKSATLEHARKIPIQLRPCQPGEYNNSNICEPCVFQTYSLDPSVPCTRCPANAFCPDSATICPKSGYWNFDNRTVEVLKCKDEKAGRCERREGECRTCKEGYTGPFCSACDFEKGFVESGYFECTRCENPQKALLFVILGGVLYFICQMVIFSVLYRDAQSEQPQIQRSFYIKTLISYAQLMSTLCLTSSQIYQHFGISSQIGSLSSLVVYGTQCSMFALGIEYQDFIYYLIVFITLLPIIQIVIGTIFIKIASFKPQDGVFGLMILYILLISQPGLVANLTLFLSCTELSGQGDSWISSHSNWSCSSSSKYEMFTRYFTLPNFILWAILIPIFFALFIKKKGENSQQELSIRWLSLGLKDEKKYWIILTMMFKLVLGVLVYELGVQVDIQIFSSLLLLWLYQILARLLKPYSILTLNDFEVRMVNLLMFNIIVSKYLLDASMGSFINQISFYVIVIINAAFVINAFWKIITLSLYKKDSTITLDEGLLLSNE